MSNSTIYILAASYIAYSAMLFYVFSHPTYDWSTKQVAREHIYDYKNPFNER